MNCFMIMYLCVLLGASLFVLGLVILCFVYFLFVVSLLPVPVQSIAWKDHLRNDLFRVEWKLNHTHLLTLLLCSVQKSATFL